MRTLKLVSVVGAVLLVGSLIGYAQAQPSFSIVNGGGQIRVEVDPDSGQGTGDTIAFTVRDEDNTVGQVQYVERTGGTGQNQIVQHGTPDCLFVQDNMAQFDVEFPDIGLQSVFVEEDVDGAGTDTVTIAPGMPGCGDEAPDEATELAEGSVEVQDNQ